MATPSSSRIEGVGASAGVAMGRACVTDASRSRHRLRHISRPKVEGEISRLEAAVRAAVAELEAIKQAVGTRLGESHLYILDVGLLLLRDEMLIGKARERIRDDRTNAEWAVQAAVDHFSRIFEAMDDPYLRDRRLDIGHAGERILRHLAKSHPEDAEGASEEAEIIVAHDLTPADVATLSRGQVLGFVTDLGGRTSHTAIMAEALGIPAVVGAGDATRRISTGNRLIVDGRAGRIIVNPSAEDVAAYEADLRARSGALRSDRAEAHQPAVTQDGVRIIILANIEHDRELESLGDSGVDGVGLFRSEHLYFNREDLPSEEEHYQRYRRLAEAARPNAALVRTLDLGADRQAPVVAPLTREEPNPALGVRAIRFTLRRPDIFKRQLRAILRASVHGELSLMYPMVSGVEEVRAAQALLEEAKAELRAEGRPFADDLKQGVLIETPAAALCADHLARAVDFLGVGTNDLVQYTLAVDRLNKQVAHLYEPLHPAILRLLHGLVRSARSAGVPISVCGELAGDAENALYLVGLGFRSLSMAMSKVAAVKRAIRRASLQGLEELTSAMLECESAEEVRALLNSPRRALRLGRSAILPAV